MTSDTEEAKRTTLRLPPTLYEIALARSESDGRSLNQWITQAIEFYLAYDSVTGVFDFPSSPGEQERLKFEYIVSELRKLLDQAETEKK